MKKILTLVTVLVMLSASTALAQDPCDKYHDIYRVCVEKRDAGREVDYNVCEISPCNDSENDCNNCGCYWRADKEACMTDICISENSGDGMVSATDYGAIKKEYLRTGCPTTPTLPYPEPITCEGEGKTLSALGRWCDQGDGTVKDMTTGLVWLQNAGWGGLRKWEDCITHDDAHTRAGILEEGTSGAGLSVGEGSVVGDWRLPTETELVGITVGDEYIRSSQMHFFTGVQSSYYWSSTTVASLATSAWIVSMYSGNMGTVYKSNSYYVWPVRGGND